MPKPRVFISSTFYDLKHIRASLEMFVEQLGYEPVLSEKGSISYDPSYALDESCYREVRSTDIFVLLIGGRYGSEVSSEKHENVRVFYDRYESITKREYESASERDLPCYILVEKSVYAEYETFKNNRGNNSIVYAHVDSINIFHFLDGILSRPRNNPVYQFERHTDIQSWLRDQWAGLFRDLLSKKSESKQIANLAEQVAGLSSVSTTLKRYLENVISKVGENDEASTQIIQSEELRLEEDRQRRAALKVGVVSELIDTYEFTEDQALDPFRSAKSINELVQRICEYSGGRLIEAKVIDHWRNNSEAIDDVNLVRGILNLPRLAFIDAEEEHTKRVAAARKRKTGAPE